MEDLTANDSNGLDYAILESLKIYGEPMGSGTLHYELRKRGSTPSAPTIGRKLRDLEHRGLVAKVSVEGRILTPEGQKLLKKLQQQREREISGEKFLTLLRSNGRTDIVDR